MDDRLVTPLLTAVRNALATRAARLVPGGTCRAEDAGETDLLDTIVDETPASQHRRA
ncbi:hypothetical protein GCM10023196_083330 [Actinoallomurus vinaceus]|uniref:Uncharacterized protein n=1 Tax=Actinoallomurus vinaceus TaxID=1080074 RepID=A0ABP8UQ49_9ACTN